MSSDKNGISRSERFDTTTTKEQRQKREQDIAVALRAGETYTTIQAKFNVYPSQVSKIKKKYGIATTTLITTTTNKIPENTHNDSSADQAVATTTNKIQVATTNKTDIIKKSENVSSANGKSSSSEVVFYIMRYLHGKPTDFYCGSSSETGSSSGERWEPKHHLLMPENEAISKARELISKYPDAGFQLWNLNTRGEAQPKPEELMDLGGPIKKQGGVVADTSWFTTNRACSECKTYSKGGGNSLTPVKLILTRKLARRGCLGVCPHCGRTYEKMLNNTLEIFDATGRFVFQST